MGNEIQYINPSLLSSSPSFSQVITTQGAGKTIYVGGQNSVNKDGVIVGKENIQMQTEQVMQNIQIALSACNATFENVVKLSIYIVQGQNVHDAFFASRKHLDNLKNPPIITVIIVVGLANPDFLLEIETTAFIPNKLEF